MVLPFTVVVRTGRSLHDQVVFAATKAVVTGQLSPGDAFPSVRTLSQELGINPNTAQKIVATLIERGLLESRPGVGTVVSSWQPSANPARRALLVADIERLVVDAKQLGIPVSDVIEAIRKAWK
ncbi:MAG TPA: GntR family transcriptional regulator [Vicinamibacterales bacterium]|jgi:GntR family transcriptional regulator|nr:GntR family transcriptional regulator [Vicinamibacterales bacterium]